MFGLVLVAMTATAFAKPMSTPLTRAKLRKLANGTIAPELVIDPDLGIVELEYTSGSDSLDHKAAEIRTSERLCGDAATQWLAGMRRGMREIIRRHDHTFVCVNHPIRKCTLAVVSEWEKSLDFEFRATDSNTLVLDAIVTRSVAPPKDEQAVLATLRAQQATTTCAP